MDSPSEKGSQPNALHEPALRGVDSVEETDQYLVDWDGDDDPENPQNWTSRRKNIIIALLSSLTFVTPLASSMFAPGIQYVDQTFHQSSDILSSLVVSVYLVGYAFGPLLAAPLCEIYGRAIVYQTTNILFVIFTIACAVAPSFNSLIGFRFLAGSAGSAPLVLGGGTIADMFKREERGAKMALFSMGPLIGPVAGPIAGAFLAENVSWRWIFWVITIAAGVVCVAALAFLRETYAPVLLERNAAKLRKETGNNAYRPKLSTGDSPKTVLIKAFSRPAKMFTRSPLVFMFTMYISVVYGFLYLLFVTITEVFENTYHWSTGIAGLSFLGIGIGMFIGLAVFGATSDRRIRGLQAKAIAEGKTAQDVPPEVRLEGMLAAAICIPVGLFWYGWSAEKKIAWIMPIIGTGWFGMGLIGIFLSVQTYLVDCFPLYAASVTSTHTVVRSLLAAFLPLAGQPLYKNLGLGWGNSVLGFIAAAMIPLPLILMKYGGKVRTNPRFQVRL
ncbi:MFS general substrate transporter [Myriangium duriaei CBS 260.36]|uniref:Cercosporin MFS transporter CTB4 n=1 Tax=Myriangium duriaei CBS 260.36 TaxID=1168546 RepID=A0A9P4J9H4_9PEZI|nr:MFS general substrate transporter [Myriangium duriaei CBS 260.36]